MTKMAAGLPVNELGEVVFSAGSGSLNVVGVLAPDAIPVDVNGALQSVGVVDVRKNKTVAFSRLLTKYDDGLVLEMVFSNQTLWLPPDLPVDFSCIVIPNIVTTVASSDVAGRAEINGGFADVLRSSTNNPLFIIQQRVLNNNKYVVSGI